MDRRKLWLWVVNVVGGIAVLGSYALGIGGHDNAGDIIWGRVPVELKPLYNVSMLGAAVGYFPFTLLVAFKLDPERTRIAGRFGYGLFPWLYAVILVPSAAWMPLTFAHAAEPSAGLWWAIRAVLWLVGAGSIAMVWALWKLDERPEGAVYPAAILGALAFTFQTGLLDAFVWPYFW